MVPTYINGLRERRDAAGFSRQTLAGMAGCSIGLIAALERGYRSDGPKVRAVAEVLGCTVADLYAETSGGR